MLPLASVLTLARKAYKFREARKDGGEKVATPKKPMSSAAKLRLFIALPLIITGIAFILSVLCVFAGSKPGMMDDYAVFSLNTSRIGENVLAELNGAIKSADLKFKRSEPATAPMATITPAPTTMITMAPRDILSDIQSLNTKGSSKAESAKSALSSKATSVKSDVASKASSAESAAKSAANSAIASVQDKVVELVNKAFRAAIDGMHLEDIYNIHISSSCVGTYVYKDGKNYTYGDTKNLDQLRPRIDSCEGHSAVNPFNLVKGIYWVGFLAAGVAFLMGIVGIIMPTKKLALINIFGTLPSVIFMGLASAVTHGIGVGAKHLVGFIGDKIGVTGTLGSKFIQLTWTATIMLLINMCLWIAIYFHVKPKSGDRKRPDRTSTIAMGQYTPEVSRPQPAHIDRNGHAMI